MGFHIRGRIASAALVATLAACGGSSPSKSSSGARPGTPGQSFLVTVQRPEHGTVYTADRRIDCGPSTALCGPASFAWDEVVTLVATPATGYMMGTWVGDCTGRPTNAAGEYVCVLDTRQYGADKWVGATFAPTGRALHPNFSQPAVHGPAFMAFVARAPGYYECTACHAPSYDGLGIAPSCNKCHEDHGFPSWRTNCNFCHSAPPSAPHPATGSSPTVCFGCHPTTVDATGTLIPGGTHMNGALDGGGHLAGYASPALHARDFFEGLATPGGPSCVQCHGATYGAEPIPGGATCNGCHAAAGWQTPLGEPNWQTNCSFCHGTRSALTQPGFDVTAQPALAAPPHAISERLGGGPALDRTGAHQIHLVGSSFAGPFPCATCHDPVPTAATALTHIHGRAVRSPVIITAPGAVPTQDPNAYNPATGTCATYCHGATASPAWSSTGLQCNGCHGLPPGSPAHGAVSSDLAGCSGCHPDTMTAGTINVAGGRHLNGRVDVVRHPDGYASPALHARDFFEVALMPAPTCTGCHGATYDVPVASGQSCNSCHAAAGWRTAGGTPNWQTNCSFCHGTRSATTQPGYDVALQPALAAPPHAISERLGFGPAPDRTGAHQIHLTGSAIAGPFPCATCHDPVPTAATALSHIHGRAVRSPVIITGPGTPTPNTTAYDQATGTCGTYCHGTGRSPAWSSSAGVSCNTCHGQPPATLVHSGVSSSLTGCRNCHPDTMNPDGTINLAGGQHIDGTTDADGHPSGYADPAVHGRDFFQTAAAAPPSCTLCHGAAYDAPIATGGQSCNTCHAASGWRTAGGTPNWQTNCSFCHGLVDATTQLGYAVADQPAWSAPPDAISQRLDGLEAPARTGAHQGHLVAGSYAGAFACDVCHTVPAALDHISGRSVRARVVVTVPGGSPDASAYDEGTGRCGTYCHGASPSPAWSTATIACNGCHGLPPATAGHATVAADVTVCMTCHPDTVDAAGAILVAGGRHLNGAVELMRHDPGYANVLVHGPQALDHFANATGALDCASCHGAAYDRVMSSNNSCNGCHAQYGWQAGGVPNWRTNCTFCHGTRVYQYTSADLMQSSPPDGVEQRLGGGAEAITEGRHRAHLTGRVAGTSGAYAPVPCSACHAVPTDPSHVSSTRIAEMVFTPEGAFPSLTPAQRAALPNPLMTYSRATGCTGYCHGSTLLGGVRTGGYPWSPSAALAVCSNCHGFPPPTGKMVPGTFLPTNYCGSGVAQCNVHQWHINLAFATGRDSCGSCHFGNGHVDGILDPIRFLTPNGTAGVVTGTWDPVQKSCSVTGSGLGGAGCHTNPGATRYWLTTP